MINRDKNRLFLFIIVLFFQLTILGVMVFNNYLIILQGEKILLRVEPVDPRSIFQGDYVILNYTINALNIQDIENDLDIENIREHQPVYLALVFRNQNWEPAFITQDEDNVQGQLYLKGTVLFLSYDSDHYTPNILHADWGIEQFFVPEGQGREIENKIQEGIIYAEIAVYHGKSRVTGLITK